MFSHDLASFHAELQVVDGLVETIPSELLKLTQHTEQTDGNAQRHLLQDLADDEQGEPGLFQRVQEIEWPQGQKQ